MKGHKGDLTWKCEHLMEIKAELLSLWRIGSLTCLLWNPSFSTHQPQLPCSPDEGTEIQSGEQCKTHIPGVRKTTWNKTQLSWFPRLLSFLLHLDCSRHFFYFYFLFFYFFIFSFLGWIWEMLQLIHIVNLQKLSWKLDALLSKRDDSKNEFVGI